MKATSAAAGILISALILPTWTFAADSDSDRSHPMTFVKDSIITTKVKAKLAEEKLSSLVHIKVDTDNKGVVWLSGTARTQSDADKAVAIARGTEGVSSVTSEIQIKKDD